MSQTVTGVSREISMYGCEIAQFKESVVSSITFKVAGVGMVVMSLMSDAQEEMAHGDVESARQTLNRAKFLISEFNLGIKE